MVHAVTPTTRGVYLLPSSANSIKKRFTGAVWQLFLSLIMWLRQGRRAELTDRGSLRQVSPSNLAASAATPVDEIVWGVLAAAIGAGWIFAGVTWLRDRAARRPPRLKAMRVIPWDERPVFVVVVGGGVLAVGLAVLALGIARAA